MGLNCTGFIHRKYAMTCLDNTVYYRGMPLQELGPPRERSLYIRDVTRVWFLT